MNMKIKVNKTVPKLFLLLIISIFISGNLYAQEEGKDSNPVYSPWTTSVLIDNQTTVCPEKGSFELVINHRFGKIKEMKDLFGIYAPSNIRMGLQYGITENIMVGFGTEKDNKMQELYWKWNIFPQKESGMPVSIAYFGNVVLDARDQELFGSNYVFTDRMSYINQVIIGKKFSDKLSLQVAGGYAHFNSVDSVKNNGYFGISLGGRYKVYNEISLLAEWDQPLPTTTLDYQTDYIPKANYAFGVEFGTGTHAFQVFTAQYKNIITQKNLAFNLNDAMDGPGRIGFNIIVRFF